VSGNYAVRCSLPLDVKGVGRAKDTTGGARPVSGLLLSNDTKLTGKLT
jgi:hypothetical protein